MAHPGRGGMLWLYHTARATPSGDIRPEVVHAGVNKAVARFGTGGPRPKNVTCPELWRGLQRASNQGCPTVFYDSILTSDNTTVSRVRSVSP